MHKIIAWWLKHSLLIMAVTIGFYLLGQIGAVFEFIRVPFKILLMLLMIEATPLGAVVGWAASKTMHFILFLSHKLSQSQSNEP